MTHVSKHKIEPAVEQKIIDAFMRSLLSTSQARGKARIYAILTPVERLMLAKRLAIISMLNRNDSYYKIETTLNVSGSTIQRLHKRFLAGEFDPLCRIFNRKLSFGNYLELFLAAGMPAIGGPKANQRLVAMRTGRKPKR